MVATREELTAIADLAIQHDLLVVTDEVYEHLVFDGEHIPIATLPGMRERTVTISSGGKTFSFTGWKIGWVTGTPRARDRSTDSQAVPYLRQRRSVPVRHCRRARASGRLLRGPGERACTKSATCSWPGCAAAGFEVFVPQGTYFISTDITPLGESDGLAFCRSLPHRCGVVAVPNVVFYDNQAAGRSHVRFAFCKKDEVLADAGARLATLRPRLKRPERRAGGPN